LPVCIPAAVDVGGDGVPDRADLEVGQVVELVAPVGGGGQAEPAAGGDLLDRVLERRRRDMMAFVGDDQAIARGERADVLVAGQGLQGGDVDGPAELAARPRSPLASGSRLGLSRLRSAGTWGYGLSYRDVGKLMAERGVTIDHVTIYRWAQRFTPEFIEAARPCHHAPGDRWYVDETYLKVSG
jgi:hypothetical protein